LTSFAYASTWRASSIICAAAHSRALRPSSADASFDAQISAACSPCRICDSSQPCA